MNELKKWNSKEAKLLKMNKKIVEALNVAVLFGRKELTKLDGAKDKILSLEILNVYNLFQHPTGLFRFGWDKEIANSNNIYDGYCFSKDAESCLLQIAKTIEETINKNKLQVSFQKDQDLRTVDGVLEHLRACLYHEFRNPWADDDPKTGWGSEGGSRREYKEIMSELDSADNVLSKFEFESLGEWSDVLNLIENNLRNEVGNSDVEELAINFISALNPKLKNDETAHSVIKTLLST